MQAQEKRAARKENERERIAGLIKEWNLFALEELEGIAKDMANDMVLRRAEAAAAAAAAAEAVAAAKAKQQLAKKIENLRRKLDFPVGYRPKTESDNLKKTLEDLQELERDLERKKKEEKPMFFKADLRL
jgi:methylthioribose-1-phosphate isomerase